MQGDGFIADKNLFWQKERKKFFTILGWLVRCQHFNNKL